MGERPTTAGIGWLAVAAGVLVNSKLVNVLFLPCRRLVRHRSRRAPRRSRSRVARPAARRRRLRRVLLRRPVAQPHQDRLALRQRLPDPERRLLRRSLRRRSTASCSRRERAPSSTRRRWCSPCSASAPRGCAAAPRPRSSPPSSSLSLVFNAKFRHWHADYCWGPRHLTALTPLVLLLAFPWLPEALAPRPRSPAQARARRARRRRRLRAAPRRVDLLGPLHPRAHRREGSDRRRRLVPGAPLARPLHPRVLAAARPVVAACATSSHDDPRARRATRRGARSCPTRRT